MKLISLAIHAAVIPLIIGLAGCSATITDATSYSPEDLDGWAFYGIGEKSIDGDMFSFSEKEQSKGVMIVSPMSISADVVVSCEMKANTADTVLVIALAFSDAGEFLDLSVPAAYDGAIHWLFETDNYFFAFRNAPHKRKPFVRKNPSDNKSDVLVEIDENVMNPGEWKRVEAGVKDGNLWLEVGGKRLFEVTDPAPLEGGFLAFRIRGTATGVANVSMRNLSITHP